MELSLKCFSTFEPINTTQLSPHCDVSRDISRFSPRIDLIFSGEAFNPFLGALIHFLVLKMKDSSFVLHNCILVLDAEQVGLEPQVTNLNFSRIRKLQ